MLKCVPGTEATLEAEHVYAKLFIAVQ